MVRVSAKALTCTLTSFASMRKVCILSSASSSFAIQKRTKKQNMCCTCKQETKSENKVLVSSIT
jgi:hypothetical protein